MNKWLLTLATWLGGCVLVFGLETQATLVLEDETVVPGETNWAAVVLKMSPGWHTYWRNPGQSGMATEIEWKLPEGVHAGKTLWPVPEYFDSEGLVTYVLHNTAVLLVPLEFSSDLQPGPLKIEATVSWLECQVLCVPGDATITANVVIGSESKPSSDAELIRNAQAQLPMDGSALNVQAGWEGPAEGDERGLILEWPATKAVDAVQFFPNAANEYEVDPRIERMPVDQSRVTIRATVNKFKGDWPSEIGGVITTTAGGHTRAFHIQTKITDHDSLTAEAGSSVETDTKKKGLGGLPFYLLMGLGGGLILNLMPCVLPILSLKVLSLVRQSGSSAAERRKHGIIYTLGVLTTFLIISGLVIAGRLASWGAQFQDPRFVVAVTVLMTLVALNLFGVFEVVLPGSAVTSSTQLASREGASGAFFNGVLAVVLGASCVAPLLAPAIGWAVSQTPLVIVLVFVMIGFGLALPFLVLSFFPSLQHLLPKPGPWMEKFKVMMGFPMLATAAWLLSQTTDHFGAKGPLWVGLFLVMLALAMWIYGEFIQRGRRHKWLAVIFTLVFAVGGYAYALEHELNWRHPDFNPPDNLAATNAAGDGQIQWQPWSPAAVEAARKEARPVLVDFTANWCLTCKLNKKTSLEIDPVREKLQAINAVALKGDYTRKNPEITEELKRFERAGVPLVLVYPANPSKPPMVLPTLLTPGIVLDALDQAVQ